MSVNYKYATGLGNVGSYQVSGKPYVSGNIDAMQGAAVRIAFPSVTRWIYVVNHEDSAVRVGFSERGVLSEGNYFQVGASSTNGGTQASVRLEVKVTEIFLSGSENVDVVAHCVRVPVFVGHSEAVFIECENPMDEEVAREVLTEMEGVIVIDHRADEGYITPKEAAGEDGVYISRIRRDESVPSGLVFWCVSDNLRKGAALNAVQIAELAISQGIK